MGRRKDGLTLAEVRERLRITGRDIEQARRNASPLALVGETSLSFGSELAFVCACCSMIEGEDVVYGLDKETTGCYGARVDPRAIRTTRGIVRLRDLRTRPEYSSVPHVTKDGLVCQHCYDSVYTDEPQIRGISVTTLSVG